MPLKQPVFHVFDEGCTWRPWRPWHIYLQIQRPLLDFLTLWMNWAPFEHHPRVDVAPLNLSKIPRKSTWCIWRPFKNHYDPTDASMKNPNETFYSFMVRQAQGSFSLLRMVVQRATQFSQLYNYYPCIKSIHSLFVELTVGRTKWSVQVTSQLKLYKSR